MSAHPAPLVATTVRRHRRGVLGSIALGLLGVACSLAQPAALAALLVAVVEGSRLTGPLAVLAGLFLGELVLGAAQSYTAGRIGESIVFAVRTSLLGRVLRADLGAFHQLRQGDVLSRITGDAAVLKLGYAQGIATLVVDGAMVLGALVLMLLLDPWLLLISAAALGGTGSLTLLLARGLGRVSLRSRTIVADLTADTQRALGALTTVKGCRAEVLEEDRLGELADRSRRTGNRLALLSAGMSPTLTTGIQASLAVVVLVGAGRVADGGLPLESLTAFAMYLFYLVTPLVGLSMAAGQLQQSRAAASRVDELAQLPQEPWSTEPDPATPTGSRLPPPVVEFRDVHFGYAPDQPVLRGLTFTAGPGTRTAIIGGSGAGKSTVLDLLVRLYPRDRGAITIDGVDIDDIPLPELRRTVAVVRQDSPVLRGSLRENLRYGTPGASSAELDRAVHLACLDDLVSRLPRGLDTDVCDGGYGLSGGERQRLAIARALVGRPRVLLLDEVTAHLDAVAEDALRSSIRRVSDSCTVLSVAHRMSTVVDAHLIVLVGDGRVEASGTHEELSAISDPYRRVCALQTTGPDGAADADGVSVLQGVGAGVVVGGDRG